MRTDLIVVLLSALSSGVNSYVFYFIPDIMNWTEVQTYCRQHHTDLATVNDQTDFNELLKTHPKGFKANIWIGLYRKNGKDPWVFSDGSNSPFRPWLSGQPNNYTGIQDCVLLDITGYWNDWECEDKLAFICYEELIDDHVGKGLTEDAKLSWMMLSGESVFQRMWYQKKDSSNSHCRRNESIVS